MFQQVFAGEATWSEDQLLNLTRNKYLEETYMTWSYSPLRGSDGSVSGILTPITETTKRVLGERRLKTLREFGSRSSGIENVDHACKITGEIFTTNNADVPFSAMYLLDSTSQKLILKSTSNIPMGSNVAPLEISLQDTNPVWPVAQVLESNSSVRVDNLEQKLGFLPGGQWPESAQSAVVCPIVGDRQAVGVLILGLNPRRVFDDDYVGYFELLCGQVSKAISNVKAYEEERKRAEALAAIDKAKTAFFSNVSHEFRTPLTLILGPLEDALLDTEFRLPPVQRERLSMVQHNAMRLLRLVNSLLDFSRIEAGRMAATYEPVDIVSRTVDLTSVFRSAFEKAGLELLVDVQDQLKLDLYVDRDMWEKVSLIVSPLLGLFDCAHIVYNLLSNAMKYTIKGKVTVSLLKVNSAFELHVKDTGVGISEEELPRVFERFHRVENSAGRSHEGTGIGLALTKELVCLHGGEIFASSVFGEGTTFTVRIPLGSGHLPQKQVRDYQQSTRVSKLGQAFVQEALKWLPQDVIPDSDSDDSSSLSTDAVESSDIDSEIDQPSRKPSGKILLADDNADMREYVSTLLRKYWEVVTTCDGMQALNALRLGHFDLVLSDVMMPHMDGFQFLAAVRADPALRSTPVVLLSARAGEEAAIEGLQAGADDYLIKPFSGKELIARVSTHLELSKFRSQLERLVVERTKSLAQANDDLHQQIKERVNAEEALRDSEHKYRTLARASPVAIIHTDITGNATYLNDRWVEITGFSVAQGLGPGWLDLIHEEDKHLVIAAFKRAGEDSSFKLEFRYENKRCNPPEVKWVLGQDLPVIHCAK